MIFFDVIACFSSQYIPFSGYTTTPFDLRRSLFNQLTIALHFWASVCIYGFQKLGVPVVSSLIIIAAASSTSAWISLYSGLLFLRDFVFLEKKTSCFSFSRHSELQLHITAQHHRSHGVQRRPIQPFHALLFMIFCFSAFLRNNV